MIEAKVTTNLFGAESIGGGLYPAELAECERRVREAKKPETARYCENPECRVLKLTGERQRLSAYNIVIEEKGAYRGAQPSRVCSWCIQAGVELPEKERERPEVKWERPDLRKEQCLNGHDIAKVGRYESNGECRQCKKEVNIRRNYRGKAKREAEREVP